MLNKIFNVFNDYKKIENKDDQKDYLKKILFNYPIMVSATNYNLEPLFEEAFFRLLPKFMKHFNIKELRNGECDSSCLEKNKILVEDIEKLKSDLKGSRESVEKIEKEIKRLSGSIVAPSSGLGIDNDEVKNLKKQVEDLKSQFENIKKISIVVGVIGVIYILYSWYSKKD
jgi:DNA repair exonuclease SbcCD ATPase subunit